MRQNFPPAPLQDALDRVLGADTTLDSDKIKTGLMIMTKRLDTGSPWPLHNCDRARVRRKNAALRLTQIVRASTAAPTYCAPAGKVAIFRRATAPWSTPLLSTGASSPFNDPALQLLMLAALRGHGFRWPTGKDKLLIVSVGTGQYRESLIGAGGHRRPGGARRGSRRCNRSWTIASG